MDELCSLGQVPYPLRCSASSLGSQEILAFLRKSDQSVCEHTYFVMEKTLNLEGSGGGEREEMKREHAFRTGNCLTHMGHI